MKNSITNYASVITIALAFSACTVASHTEKAAGINFTAYKTYAWTSNASNNRPAASEIVSENIKAQITEELIKKGLHETASKPDVLVDFKVGFVQQTRRESTTVYSRPFVRNIFTRRGAYSIDYPSMPIGTRSQNVPVNEDEVSVNMIDSKTNKTIWQGWAEGNAGRGRLTSKEAMAQVKSIFKKFDYRG